LKVGQNNTNLNNIFIKKELYKYNSVKNIEIADINPLNQTMKRLLLLLIFSTLFCSLKSQVKALTENGREVVLYDNGTWKYVSNSANEISNDKDEITTNSHSYFKGAGATFLVKSNRLNIGVFMNPTKWTFSAHKENEVNPEYTFTLKSGMGYGIIISEKTEINLLELKKVALKNAQDAAPDAKITSAEYRTVNNIKVLCMKFTGTISGIKFVYFGYYYSNSNGTVQFLTYTSEKMFDEAQTELESLLNGFTVVN
jgi:hypothetical protein